ncbi:ATP-binding protein [Streptomyces sp. NPDC021093]|uniref:ATP-binding protein n=1 Tax=Streptomyces sp. NPDC021093 TaxID=3365112 RepID=UPI0037887F14
MAERSAPNETIFRLTRSPESVPRARATLRAVLNDWLVDEQGLQSAELVVSELVTNAVRAPVTAARGRLVEVRARYASGDGLLTLEVSDEGDGMPEARVPEDDETRGRGLLLVQALAERWGVRKRSGGSGKTVWAELKAGRSSVPVIVDPTVAAITVRPGQAVRVWGTWRTVRSVRFVTEGRAVVLGLDEGPALRLRASEPLTVRGGAAPG